MKSRATDFLIPLIILLCGTAVIAITDADLRLAALFYIGGKWPVGELPLWQLFYKLDRIPSLVVGLCGLGAIFLALFRHHYRYLLRPGLFLVILLAIGPGLLVNAVFKEYWGRPRPREIVQFSGTKQFLHPWQPGVPHKGRSFPSGHASAAFYLSAPYFLLRRHKRRAALLWLSGGLAFGILMSIARITQGAHFLSDTLWAFGVVALCALLLATLFRLDDDSKVVPVPDERHE